MPLKLRQAVFFLEKEGSEADKVPLRKEQKGESQWLLPGSCGKGKMEIKYAVGLQTMGPNLREQILLFSVREKSKAEEY